MFNKKNIEVSNFYHDEISVYIFPAITQAAFSCELALKAIIKIEYGKSMKGHDLEKLFYSLSKEITENLVIRIIELYNSKTSLLGKIDYIDYDDFNKLLRIYKDTFTKWRYFYENPQEMDLDFIEAFMFSLNGLDEEYSHFIRNLYIT